MKRNLYRGCCLAFAVMVLAVGPAAAQTKSTAGSLITSEFPDVVDFDFEKVHKNYERAGENVGKVTPILDKALESGQAAIEAGSAAKASPTDENKRRFIQAVQTFIKSAGNGRSQIGRLYEEVRGINSQVGILYAQATTETQSRVDKLRDEFKREEIKYKDLVKQNKARRRSEALSEWDLRKMFEEEKRQAQVLNRLTDQIAFQNDFHKALAKALEQSGNDFALYEQFFVETADALTDISDLASNLPIVVERLQIAAAMNKNIPSRRAAIAGFAKIEETRKITRQIAQQLMDIASGELNPGETTAEEKQLIERRAESYKRWLDGEGIEYRKPEKD